MRSTVFVDRLLVWWVLSVHRRVRPVMDTSRPDQPPSLADRLHRDPIKGMTFARLRDRHKPVSERRELVTKGRAQLCSTCRTIWPCEVGQALDLVGWVLVRA